jgi:hypothetical protein
MPEKDEGAGIMTEHKCPSCGGELTPDDEYPDDLLCGFCEYVYDRVTMDFVEAFS